MKITQILIRNILGIQEIEIKPGSETVLEGPNASGKTSILNAIRAAFGFGHDATLLRKGQKKGEVVLVLDDGTQIEKTITATRSDSKVSLPNTGRISASKRFIDSLLDRFALNPVDFLIAPPKYRAELLLESMPLELTLEQVNACLPVNFHLDTLDGKHPLEVIASTTKMIYDERTGINRVARTATAAAMEARKALPEEAEGGDWDFLLKEKRKELDTQESQRQLRVDSIRTTMEEKMAETEKAYRLGYNEAQQATDTQVKQLEVQIAALQQEVGEIQMRSIRELNDIKTEQTATLNTLKTDAADQLKAFDAEQAPVRDEIKKAIADIEAKRDVHMKAQSLRDLIKQRETEAEKAEAASEILTRSLDELGDLKESLIKSLPIQGVEIREGEVYVFEDSVQDYIPFDRANDARRVRIAVEIAKIRTQASKVPLILVDRMQELDPNQFALFEKEVEAARAEGFQFIMARATGDEALKVRTK